METLALGSVGDSAQKNGFGNSVWVEERKTQGNERWQQYDTVDPYKALSELMESWLVGVMYLVTTRRP